MQYIPLNTYFDANFQTRLYYSDRQNLLNWLNELDGTEIKNIQFERNNQKYQKTQEQYYGGMEESTKKKNRTKSQSVPGYAIWLQSQETFNSTTKYNIDLGSNHAEQDKSSQQPRSFDKKRSSNHTNRPPHPHNHHSTQPNQYYFTTRTEVRPQQANNSYQQALQIKEDIERIKREIEQLKKMKQRTKSTEMSSFEKRVGVVEEACKECERRVEGNNGKSKIQNEARDKSTLQGELKEKSSNKDVSSRNHSKKQKKKRKDSMSSKQCPSQKQLKSDKDVSKPLQPKQTHSHTHITAQQLTHFQHLKLLQQQFNQIQQLVNSKLLNYHKNKSFTHQNSKPSLNRTEQRTSGLVLDSSFHYSPSKQAVQEKSLLAQLEGMFERMEREVVYNQRELLRAEVRVKEQSEVLARKEKQIQTIKVKLQKLQTEQTRTQPSQSPLNLCTSCLPKSNVSSSSNTHSRTQTQLSVCRNNFKSFFTIIKNTLLRQPSIKQSLSQQSLKQLSQAQLSKQGRVEKGMEIMVRCLDGLVSENLKLKIDLESKENACNRSFSYVETRIEKTINQHVLDELERSRHSIEKNYRVGGGNERTHERTHQRTHRSTTSTSNHHINPTNSYNPISTTSTLHLPTQPTLPLQLQSQLHQLKLQLSSKDHTILKLSQLLQQKQLQLQKLHIFIQKSQLRLKSTQQLTQTQEKTIEQLKYYIEERQYQFKKTQQLLQHKQDENKDLQKYLTKVETLALQVKDQNATLKDMMDQWKHQNNKIKDQRASLLQYVTQLQDKEKKLQAIINDRDNAIGQLKTIIKEYEQGYRQLEERYYEEIQNKLKREDSSNNSNSDQVNGNSNNNNSDKHNNKNNKPILIKDTKQHHHNNSDNYHNPTPYPNLPLQSLIQILHQRDTLIQSLQQQNSHLQQKLQNNLQLMLTFRNQCNDLQQQINLLNRINNQGQVKKGEEGSVKESRRVISDNIKVIEQRPEREEESGKKQENWGNQINDSNQGNSNKIMTISNINNNQSSALITVRNNHISTQVTTTNNTLTQTNNTNPQSNNPPIPSIPKSQCSNCLKLSQLITKLRQQNNILHQKLFNLEHQIKQLHQGRQQQQKQSQRNDTFFRYNNIKNQYMEKMKKCDHNWKEGDVLEDQMQVKQEEKEEERWEGEGGNVTGSSRSQYNRGMEVGNSVESNRMVIDDSNDNRDSSSNDNRVVSTTTTIPNQNNTSKVQSNPSHPPQPTTTTTNTTNTNNTNNTNTTNTPQPHPYSHSHHPSPTHPIIPTQQLLSKIQQLQHKIKQLQQQLSNIQGHNHNNTNKLVLQQQQPHDGLCRNCLKQLGSRQQDQYHQGGIADGNGSRLVSGIEQQTEEEGLLRKRSSRFNNHGSSIIKSNSGSAIKNNFTQRKNSQIIINPNQFNNNNHNTTTNNNTNINTQTKSNNNNSNTLQPTNTLHSNPTPFPLQHHHNQQQQPTYPHNQSFQSHQSRQSIPRRQPSTLLNELQIQGFNQKTLSNINNPLSSRTTPRKEDDDEHPLREDQDREHHQSPIIPALPQTILPQSHLQLPLPHQPKQQQQQSPDDNLLKRNRGDRRPSFLVYKDNSSLFNVLGWDSQRTRRVDPKDIIANDQQDKNKSNTVAKLINSQIQINNSNRNTIIEQPNQQSQPNNTIKQSQRSSIQVNNRNVHSQQQQQSDMNSPKRKLRRDSSTSSVIVMDLDKSYRHDVSISRNQQEQDVVSPIEKLKRKYLQENNKGDNSDSNNMVLDSNDNDDNQQQQQQQLQIANDKSVRFNLNPIRQLSHGSQSTSKISTHSNKKKQLAQLQNNLQTQIQPIIQNNQNIALSGDSTNNNNSKLQSNTKGHKDNNSNNSNNKEISHNNNNKQLLDIISTLRQQNQFLTQQFQRLNHQFIQLEKWKEFQCNRRIQALALEEQHKKGTQSSVNVNLNVSEKRKEELDRTIINLLKTQKMIEDQAKQRNKSGEEQGIRSQQQEKNKPMGSNNNMATTAANAYKPKQHPLNPTVLQSQVTQLHFSQHPLTHQQSHQQLIHQQLQFLRQLLVDKQEQLLSKEKLILTNQQIRQLLVELKRLLEEKENKIAEISVEMRKREEESRRLGDELRDKEQLLDQARRTLIIRDQQQRRREQQQKRREQQQKRKEQQLQIKEEQISRLVQMITGKDTTITSLNNELYNIKQQLQHNPNLNDPTLTHKHQLKAQLINLTNLTNHLSQQNHKLSQQINRLSQQNNNLTQQLALIKQQNIRLLAQNQASQHTQSIIVEQYDNKLGQLAEKVSRLLEENEGLKGNKDNRVSGDNNEGQGDYDIKQNRGRQDVLQQQRKDNNNNNNNNNNNSNSNGLIGGQYNPPMGPQVNIALKQLLQQQQHQKQQQQLLLLQHNHKQLLKQQHNNNNNNKNNNNNNKNTNNNSQHHPCTICNCQPCHQPHNHMTTDLNHQQQPTTSNPLQSLCCIATHHYIDQGEANQNQITKMELQKENFVRGNQQVETVKIIGNNGMNENWNNRKEEDGGMNVSNVKDKSSKVLDDERGYQNVISYQHQVRLGEQYTSSSNNNTNNNNNDNNDNRDNNRDNSINNPNTPLSHPTHNPFSITCQPCLCISIHPSHPTSSQSLAYSQSPLPNTSHLVNQTKLLPQTVQLANDLLNYNINNNNNHNNHPSNPNPNNIQTQLQSLKQQLTNLNQHLKTLSNQLTQKNSLLSTLNHQLQTKTNLLKDKDNQITVLINQNNYIKQVIDYKQGILDRVIGQQQQHEGRIIQERGYMQLNNNKGVKVQDMKQVKEQEMKGVKGTSEQLDRVKEDNNNQALQQQQEQLDSKHKHISQEQMNDNLNHNHNTIPQPAISHQQQLQNQHQQHSTIPSQELHYNHTTQLQLQHLKQQLTNTNNNLLHKQSQIQSKQQLIDQNKQQITLLNQQLQKLRQLLKQKQQHQLNNNKVGKEQQGDDKKQLMKQREIQLTSLNTQLLQLRQQLDRTKQNLKEVYLQLNTTKAQFNTVNMQCNRVNDQLTRVNDQLTRVNEQLNSINNQKSRVSIQLNTSKEELSKAKQQISKLSQQPHQSNQCSQSIKSQLQSKQQQLQSTNQQLKFTNQQLANLTQQFSLSSKSLSQALKQNQHSKRVDSQLIRAQQYIEKLQLINSQSNIKLREQDQRLLKLIQQVEVNSRLLGDKAKELSVKSREIQGLKRQLQTVKQQLQSSNRQVQQLREQLQQLSNTPPCTTDPILIQQLKSKIISLLSIINQHQTQLQQLTSSNQKSLHQLQQQLFHLKQSNIFYQQENTALRKALEERDCGRGQSQQLGDKQVKSQKMLLKRKNSNRGDSLTHKGDRDKSVLEAMIDKHRAQILLLHKKLREYELQINKLKQQRQSLEGRNIIGKQTQLAKSHTLESMIQQHKKQIAQLHVQLRSYQIQMRKLKGQVQHQSSDNQLITTQNPSNQYINHSLNTSHNSQQLNILKTQLQQLRVILQNREKTYIQLLEQKDIVIQQLTEQANRRNEIERKQTQMTHRHQEQLKKKNEEIKRKTQQLKRKDEEIKRKEEQIRRKNIQFNKIKEQNNKQSTKQKQQLQQKLNKQKQQLQTKLKTALSDLSQSTQTLKTTQNQLASTKSRYDDKISQKQRIITKQGQQLIDNRKMIEKLKHQIQQQNNNTTSSKVQSPRQSQLQSNISMKRSEQVTHNETNLNLVSRTKNQNNERKQLFQIHNLVKVYVRNQNNGTYVVTNRNQSDQTNSHLNNQPEYEFQICQVDQQGNSQVKLIKQGSQFLQGNEVENLISNEITKQISKINSVHTDQQNNNNNNGNSNSVGQSRRSIYSKVEQTRSANLNQPIAKSPPKPITKSPPKSQPPSTPNSKPFARSSAQKQPQQTTQQQTKPTRARSVQQFYLQSIVPQFFRKKNNQSADKKEEENKKK